MEAVLGVNCSRHDTAAALLIDGQLVALGEEERFNREVHTSGFPHQAIAAVLRQGGIDIDDVAYVAFAQEPWADFRRGALEAVRRRAPRRLAAQARSDARLLSRTQLLRRVWGYRGPIVNVAHHLSHAAGTYFSSPFDQAAILTLDRNGDFVSTTTNVGRGNHIDVVSQIRNPDSLGEVYTSLTRFLGFRPNDEAKVMDLAALGTSALVGDLKDLVTLTPDGGFSVNPEWFGSPRPGRSMSAAFFERYGGPRPPESDITDRDKDLAHAVQDLVEEASLHLARSLRRSSSCSNLCLAGGLALNSVLNTRLLTEAGFDDVWVPPVAGAAGNALGAALWLWHEHLGRPRSWEMHHAFWGEAWSDDDCATALTRARLPHERVASASAAAASRLIAGRVVGWFQGRAETGPNALGARSVLADPRRTAMRDVINDKFAQREWFRPFGTSVLHGRGGDMFGGYRASPFGLLVAPITEPMRAAIPACAHADGTGRVHSVTPQGNPAFHELIERFEAATGVPAVLNASFHLPGEPIVHRPGEAVSDYLRSGMDSLVLGSYVVDKGPGR